MIRGGNGENGIVIAIPAGQVADADCQKICKDFLETGKACIFKRDGINVHFIFS